jgi:hypothetical protein
MDSEINKMCQQKITTVMLGANRNIDSGESDLPMIEPVMVEVPNPGHP